jgi:glycosyltransferase involved in cell wall biosynthesis
MKILDSIKHTKWKGQCFNIQNGQIIILKSALLFQNFEIQKGKYKIKIIGKKRTGNGKIAIEISSERNDVFLKQEINFNQSSMVEHTLDFEVNRNVGMGKIKLFRDKDIYGSVEIGRLFIDWTSDEKVNTAIDFQSNQKLRFVKNRINVGQTHLLNTINKNLAFIIPYKIYGGAEVYIQNIINLIPLEYQIHVLYIGDNILQSKIVRHGIEHKVFKKIEQLNAFLKSSNFEFIVFYNRLDVYQNLIDMKNNGDLLSQLVEIYHSNFTWPGSLSLIKERMGLDKLISIAPSLGMDISGIDKVDIVPVGIDLELFQPRKNLQLLSEFNVSDFKGVIGCVSRLSKEKNIDYLINLASIMKDYLFLVVGDGPDFNRINDLINDLGVSNVKLLGFKKNIWEYYNIFDAFVLNSVMEGTPISIIEAMASGVVVFSNMVGAIPDLLKNDKTGIKIGNGLIEDSNLIMENIGRQDLILNARKFVEDNHDIKKNVTKFLEIIFSSTITLTEREQGMVLLPGQYI